MAQSARFWNVTFHEKAQAALLVRMIWLVLFLFFAPHNVLAQGTAFEASSVYKKYANAPISETYRKGMDYLSKGSLDSALACLTVVTSQFRPNMNEEEKRTYIYALNNAGAIAMMRSDYSVAFSYFMKVIDVADDSIAYRTYNNIAGIYIYYNDYANARKYLNMAYDISEQRHDWGSLLNTLHNLLDLDWDMDSLQHSQELIKRFRRTSITPKGAQYQFVSKICDGMEQSSNRRYQEAIASFRQAIDIAQPLPFVVSHEVPAYMYIAKAYMQMGEYGKAAECLDICERKSRDSHSLDMLINTYKYQVLCYSQKGDLPHAREAKYRYMELKDSVNIANEYGKIKDMQFLHESVKYENQLSELRTEKRLRNIATMAILTGLLLALAFLGLMIWQNRRLARSNKDLFKKNVALIKQEEHEQQLHQQYATLLDQYQSKERGNERYRSSGLTDESRQQLLQSIREVMHDPAQFCQDDFTIDKLASLVGSNTKYVSQVINETIGKNFNTLLNEQRITEVCKRLVDTKNYGSKTNEAIAEEVGFKSRSHFIRTFKKITGLTPSQYQRMAKEQSA